MSPATAPSNIRAYVQYREPSVFAGEELECIITFKNIAKTVEQAQREGAGTGPRNGYQHGRTASNAPSAAAGSRRTSVAQLRPPPSRAGSAIAAKSAAGGRGHRPALSLSVASASSKNELHAAPHPVSKLPPSAVQPGKGHGTSLSIMSLGSDSPRDIRTPVSAPAGKRPSRGHGRSASLQVVPRSATTTTNHGLGIGSPRQPSPLYESTTPPAQAEEPLAIRPGRRRPGTMSADSTPQIAQGGFQRKASKPQVYDGGFRFPAAPPSSDEAARPKPPRSPSTMHSAQQRPASPRPLEGWVGAISNLNPVTRVMSESSQISSTPRSSTDFYSMSNNSDETLTSEVPYQAQQAGRLLPRASHSRQASQSRQGSYAKPAEPETLMMGYAQITGSFVLDGSLVNAAPFEEVKRKGVQGGSGGGVVGMQQSKRTSGMFGAFSWGNLGESIGGLLGGDDMSSMAQMKATAGSKSVPLLSTPQNLLFVDLRLAPGDSRSFSYAFTLPRGLPPSHRGRAIKVQYHLSLGIQRPGVQAIKQIEVPFRVLGSYNSRGESLGHDLMSPYVLLQDAARSKSIVPDSPQVNGLPRFSPAAAKKNVKIPKQGLEDFLRYTERLLSEPREANGALLSPTTRRSPTWSRNSSSAEQGMGTVKEAIDLAILRSNHVDAPSGQGQAEGASANRFNIARSGQPVAVLTLLRPAYRLGESVTGTLDFTASPGAQQASTYAVSIELESAERVDASLALRSGASINRVTRKVYAAVHESALFARSVSLSLGIPASATPTFDTTGVSLVWRLKIEFTTERSLPSHAGGGDGEEEEDVVAGDGLLEELGSDERGTALIARERLLADTFEIEVPIRILGTIADVVSDTGSGMAPLLV